MRTNVLTLTALALGMVTGACMPAGKESLPPNVSVARVTVTPATSDLTVGGSVTLSAAVLDASGGALQGRTVSWSSNSGAATVSQSGVVSAMAPGVATITATSESVTGSATVNVSAPPPAPVATVVVNPGSNTLTVGSTVQLTATTRDANGATLTGRAITWSSSNNGYATVSASGLVSAVGAGSVTITASSEGKSGTATVVVNAPPPVPVATVTVAPGSNTLTVGGTVQLTATTRDVNGATLTGRAITWSSSNNGYATVSASGLVSAVGAGSVTITATSEGKSGTATVVVNAPPPAPVATVTVAPGSNTLTVGGTVQLTATTRDANGATLTGRAITWSSSNNGYATVSASGLVSAIGAGTATITATSEGKSGTATVVVNAPPPVPVATVTVAPSSSNVTVGGTVQLTATTRDANGATLTGRTITWSSSNNGYATVSGSGLVTAVGAGTATITATSEGKSGTASVVVNAPPPPPAGKVDTIFAEGFESGSLSRWDDEGAAQTHRVTTDPTHVHSGTHALAIDYPAGAEAGWLTKFFMPGYDSVYVRGYVFFPVGWDDQTKLLNVSGSRTDNAYSAMGKAGTCPTGTDFFNAMLVTPPNQNLGPTEFYTYYPGMGPTGSVCWGSDGVSEGARYFAARQLTTGSWHRIDFWVKVNTPGQANGLQRFWIDGQLAGEWLNVTLRTSTILRLNSVMLSFSRSPGGAVAQTLYWDDIVVTTGPIP